jgi:hypothetical protein
MNIAQKFFASIAAIAVLMPLALLPVPAQAQQYKGSQATPRIEGFQVDEVRRLAPGVELNFGIAGTPGSIATLRIAGATRNLTLVEIEAGRYEGTYTISRRDRIAARSPVTANLRIGNQVASAVLNESLQVGVGYHSAKAMPGSQPRIERFNVEPIADLSGGNGRTAAQIAGAIGGAYAGRAIEGNARKSNHYEVLVRLDSGSTQTVTFPTEPSYRAGDKVKINDGVIVRN